MVIFYPVPKTCYRKRAEWLWGLLIYKRLAWLLSAVLAWVEVKASFRHWMVRWAAGSYGYHQHFFIFMSWNRSSLWSGKIALVELINLTRGDDLQSDFTVSPTEVCCIMQLVRSLNVHSHCITDGLIWTIKPRLPCGVDCKHCYWHIAWKREKKKTSLWSRVKFTSCSFELSGVFLFVFFLCRSGGLCDGKDKVTVRGGAWLGPQWQTSANSAHRRWVLVMACGVWRGEVIEQDGRSV